MNKLLNLKIIAFFIGTLLITTQAIAQEEHKESNHSAPIPIDVFFGNNRFVSQFIISKKFTDTSRFGFLASSFIAADYENDKTQNESMNVALINYEILKGFSVVSGAALNSQWGFRPFAGVQYVYANKEFMAFVMPGFYLTESNNFETIGFVESRPQIKNDWALFTRLEGQYNLDMDTKKHDRSHIYGRLGLSYKTFSFGLASNYDWYGPFQDKKENFGVFFRNAFR